MSQDGKLLLRLYLFFLLCVTAILVGYFEGKSETYGNRANQRHAPIFSALPTKKRSSYPLITFDDIVQDPVNAFNVNNDVLLQLHIQKTGGTSLNFHLAKGWGQCRCQTEGIKRLYCDCIQEGKRRAGPWLISRFSCREAIAHPFWHELSMLHRRQSKGRERAFIVTVLREPVERYLSEYEHSHRTGAAWPLINHLCNGKRIPQKWSTCPSVILNHGRWPSTMKLLGYISCEVNQAANRQTRMLADLELFNCSREVFVSQPNHPLSKKMLNSAKENLLKTAHFGITSEQNLSRILYETIFNVQLKTQSNLHKNAAPQRRHFSENLLQKVRSINALDIELFNFAKAEFYRRLQILRIKE